MTTYDDAVSLLVQMGLMPAGELPPLVPSFTLPEPEPTGLAPLAAVEELFARFNTHDLVSYAKMVHTAAEFRDYYDSFGLLVQLGIVPGPTSVLPTTWGQIKATFQE